MHFVIDSDLFVCVRHTAAGVAPEVVASVDCDANLSSCRRLYDQCVLYTSKIFDIKSKT